MASRRMPLVASSRPASAYIRSRQVQKLPRTETARLFPDDDLDEPVAVQAGHPGPIVKHLSHDLSRRPVALELQDPEVPLHVHGQQVDELAVRGAHLPANHQQQLSQDRRILLQEVLKSSFRGQHTT